MVYFVVKRRVLIAEEGMLLYSESKPGSGWQSCKEIQGKTIYLHCMERRSLKVMMMLFMQDSKS